MSPSAADYEAAGSTLVSVGLLFLICYIIISRYRRWLDRACLQSLHEWMKSEHLDLIDVQPSRNQPPWLIPLKQRAYDVSVIDSTGRKLRGGPCAAAIIPAGSIASIGTPGRTLNDEESF